MGESRTFPFLYLYMFDIDDIIISNAPMSMYFNDNSLQTLTNKEADGS